MHLVPKKVLHFFKKPIIFLMIGALLLSQFLTPLVVFAQNNTLPSGNGSIDNSLFQVTDEQAKSVISGQTQGEQPQQNLPASELAAEGLTCSAGAVLGGVLSSAISAALNELITSVVGDSAGSVAAGAATTVPTNQTYDTSAQHQLGEARARGGTYTVFGIYINVSWDSIAWCIVNAMIEYIANATIAWANSGFNGNPAFIQNPERFFSELADYEAGKIIRDIAYGASDGQVNVCQPFKVTVALNLAQSYRGSGKAGKLYDYRAMSCKLSDIAQNNFFGSNSSGFSGKDINWQLWYDVTQNDANNPYGTYIKASEALRDAVTLKNNELKFELDINNGWLSFKKCKDNNPEDCNITTPGNLIQDQLNSTLNLPKGRLEMANKFDQMITAIVNNLIKVALNKVIEEAND